MIAVALLPSWAVRALALPPEASPTARHLDALLATLFVITLLGAFGILAFVLYCVARFRRKSELEATPRIVGTARHEWTLAALLLSLFLALWGAGYAQYLHIETPPEHVMVVYVSAKQWMWKFSYDDGQTSNDVLYLPANQRVRLVLSSRDVIHSFYAPAFRVKQDVIPGRWVNLWLDRAPPGVYPIYCAEYCGVGHSRMLGEIHVLDADDWANWRRGDKPDEMIARGRAAATKYGCLACHTLNGQRHIGPTWSRLYGSTVKLQGGATAVADDAYLTRSMMDPDAQIVFGFNPVMPSYKGHLRAEDVGAIVELIRSLKDGGGKEPAIVLPALVVQQRDGGPAAGDEGEVSP